MATLWCGKVVFTNIEAIIFDKDGTLAEVEAFLCQLAHRRSQQIEARIPGLQEALLRAFGVECSYPLGELRGDRLHPGGLMAVASRQENIIAAAAYVAATGLGWAASLDLVREAFQAADWLNQSKAKQTPLIPGAMLLLQRLMAANLRLGILSSDSQSNVDDFVAHCALNPYLSVAAGVQGNLSKSDPVLIQQVLLKLGASAAQTLMIGDSQIDIQLAKTFGLAGCIGFTGGWSSTPELASADVSTNQFADIHADIHLAESSLLGTPI
ncbi:HAD family hydrolase [Leptolyngbya ohadii]|uniref:HAD family hydrolase n=1 Tax=Leptolyngbya ohadii TaxID=1962290 RepID=UPI000B59935F|nr:HAD family hydrolase [Leptolyngbya ohadii]